MIIKETEMSSAQQEEQQDEEELLQSSTAKLYMQETAGVPNPVDVDQVILQQSHSFDDASIPFKFFASDTNPGEYTVAAPAKKTSDVMERALSEDVYSLMYISNTWSSAFVYSCCVFCVQTIVLLLICK